MKKEITLSNAEVSNSLSALKGLILSSQKLPIGLSTVCYDNIETLEPVESEMERYRKRLIKNYAAYDENGNVKTKLEDEKNPDSQEIIDFESEEDKETFIREMEEKNMEENEYKLKTVSESLISEVEASPQVIPAIRWMIEDENEET